MTKYTRNWKRPCSTVGFVVDGHEVLLTMSHRDDTDPDAPGEVFEVFLANYKDGSPYGSSLKILCSAMSKLLQRGEKPGSMLKGTIGGLPHSPCGNVFLLHGDDKEHVGKVISVPSLILQTIIWANDGYGDLYFDVSLISIEI